VIGEAKANVMSLVPSLKFTQARGVEKWIRFEGGSELLLEMKVGSGAYERAGLNLTMNETNEEKLEINSVI
jgi:hypothetical protein